MFSTIKNILSYGTVVVAASAFSASLAHAGMIPLELDVTGSTAIEDGTDTGFTFGGTGDFSLVQGGTATTSTYDETGAVITGSNPLTGDLSETGDGTGFTGDASVTDGEFAAGFDSELSVSNTSATSIFKVVFRLVFSNLVNSAGNDAFSDSELTLGDDSDEIFFSDLLSDTVFGNEIGGEPTGDSGGELLDGGDETFTYQLNPGDMVNLFLNWTLEGGDFDFESGSAAASLSAFLSIDSVEQLNVPPPAVPVPGTLLLFGLGLAALRWGARRG